MPLYESGSVYDRIVGLVKLFGPLNIKQISVVLGHPSVEVRRSLVRLVNIGILEKIPSLVDTRCKVYKVRE